MPSIRFGCNITARIFLTPFVLVACARPQDHANVPEWSHKLLIPFYSRTGDTAAKHQSLSAYRVIVAVKLPGSGQVHGEHDIACLRPAEAD